MNDADLSFFTYADSPYTVRQNLQDAHRSYWHALASPGTWFSGAERVAIAAEVRNALDCPFCAERKTALSPYSLKGEHRSDNQLDPRVVDAIHRVITDQSRITQAYIDDNASAGFTEEQYVEMVGIAVTVLSVDEFNRALGLPLETLPAPLPGGPSHYRPSQAEHGTGFVAMIPANGATGNESDLWERERTANVLRALTLVPNAMREWMAVAAQQYLSIQGMTQFTTIPGRAINRMQIELVAGRVSSHNECFY
ncbi:MAG: hypothetical protein GWP63_04910 [Haliea sp.]|jgi:hypothetical protein|nr:hypothetical protein [Haliea sp.]